ncbi:MAG TPA: O-antigen ligase family protein [Gaiellaceae bacterium]|nr:O-antigen ligase family protein [Gaiellaceae bacterium]
MRAVRELPVAAPILLAALAVFFGGGPGDGSLVWLAAGALVALVALTAARGLPGGALPLVPLLALAAFCAVSIIWSWLPDRSWDYANRTLLYALFAALGLWLADRTRLLALGLAGVVFAVVCWSLLGKVLPPLYDYGALGVTARLTGPVGLWNQLALLADFGVVLALWLRGRAGVVLAYVSLVALVLTYSRGGLLTGALAVAAWLALTDERVESGVVAVAAAVPAGVVVGIAFALPGITADHQPLSTRWRDGVVFGVLLLAGAGAALAARGRLPRPRETPALRRAAVALALLLAAGALALLALRGVSSGTVSNSQARITSTSSNFRFTWWRQAWRGFVHHPLGGTGAGSFELLNKRYRSIYLDTTIEPHDLPVQFLAETGVAGLALLAAAAGALLRGSRRRRGPELALALLLPAYLVHALVDVDWDFVAVSAPAFLAAGALAGRPPARRVGAFATLAAAGAALAVFCTFLLPWLGRRWADEGLAAPPGRAVSLANRALSADPLLVEPVWNKAAAADALGRPQQAFDLYVAAVRMQPLNPLTWQYAGRYAYSQRCWYQAWFYLERFTELDPKARASEGASEYRDALRRVDRHAYRC